MQKVTRKKERTVFIDVLKAFACLCVVIGHVIRGLRKGTIDVSPILTETGNYVYFFHVPCFFFASGYLYAYTQLENGKDYLRFLWKKLAVLGLPYFVCSIFYLMTGPIISADIERYNLPELLQILFTAPVAQYWYLYALFEMFALVPLVEFVGGGGEAGVDFTFVCWLRLGYQSGYALD